MTEDTGMTRNPQDLVKGQKYVVRGTVSGQVGATYLGRFGSELAFRTADGRHWTVPVAYFVSAETWVEVV
jgi:hypothetical protein